MTVRANAAAVAAAMDAVIARDANPLQSDDIQRWDGIRQMMLDLADSFFDAGVMQGIVLANDVITAAMIAPGAIQRDALANDSVGVDALISSGSHSVGPAVRNALQALPGGGRLDFQYMDGRITAAQAPANAVYTDAIANFVTAAQATNLVATWARESSPAGRVPSAQAAADSIVLIELNGNVLTIRPRTGTATTLTLPSGGSTPARTAALYSAITDTLRRPTAADFTTDATGNRAASGNIIQMEGWQGNRQLHIAIPTSENAISAIRQQGDPLAQNRLTARWFVARTDGALAIGADGSHNIYSTSRLIPSTLFAAAGSDAEPTFIIVQ